jgi:hypothetical protein
MSGKQEVLSRVSAPGQLAVRHLSSIRLFCLFCFVEVYYFALVASFAGFQSVAT